jgi:hypothetical protein
MKFDNTTLGQLQRIATALEALLSGSGDFVPLTKRDAGILEEMCSRLSNCEMHIDGMGKGYVSMDARIDEWAAGLARLDARVDELEMHIENHIAKGPHVGGPRIIDEHAHKKVE